jgi:FO synthase
MALAECDDLVTLMALGRALCLAGHGTHVTFSKKVFIPLTKLCRDVCHYCTFAHAPRDGEPHYLSPEAVLDIAAQGQAAGCKEALFTLGDQPELRYAAAREALRALGADTTLDYLERSAALVLKETGLLPHLNPGVMDEAWLARCARCRCRRASCWRRRRSGCRSAAAPTSARPTRCQPCGSQP